MKNVCILILSLVIVLEGLLILGQSLKLQNARNQANQWMESYNKVSESSKTMIEAYESMRNTLGIIEKQYEKVNKLATEAIEELKKCNDTNFQLLGLPEVQTK